jgi:hypothetical protein
MTFRELPWIGLRIATGVCALFVSLHGVWNLYGLDFRIDTLISVLYCLLPFLSFFVFLFIKKPKLEVVVHFLIAVGYLATYSFLNWRTCTGFGDCTTMGETVRITFQTKPVLAAFVVLVLTAGTLFLDARNETTPA